MKRSLAIGTALALMMSVAACGSGSGDSDKDAVTLTVANFSDEASARQKVAFYEPFEKETGVKFQDVAYSNLVVQLTTMVDTGKTVWDLTQASGQDARDYCGKLFEKIDFSDLGDVFPEGTTTDCSVPASKYGYVFTYDTEAYKDTVPTKIEDFFDTDKFPGKRIVRSSNPIGLLEAALVADGVEPQELYPLDIDRALKKFDTIKSDLVIVPTWVAVQQKLVDKQGTMTIVTDGILGTTFESGATIAPVWDVTPWTFNSFVVPKGSPHKKEATEAIKFLLQPDRLSEYATQGGGAPGRSDVDQSAVKYSKGGEMFSPWASPDRGELVTLDMDWWVNNDVEAKEAWLKWQTG